MGIEDQLISGALDKLKEQHLAILPHLFLSFFGNGALFLLLYYNLDASLLIESYPKGEVLLLLSILIASIGYFAFTLFTYFYFEAKKTFFRQDLSSMTIFSNYLFIAFMLIAKLIQILGTFEEGIFKGFNFLLNNFIVDFILVFAIGGIFLFKDWHTNKDKEKDLTTAYRDLLERQAIVIKFVQEFFGVNGIEILSSEKNAEKQVYETKTKTADKTITVIQNRDYEIIEWKTFSKKK